ncbi:MAG: CotH kinase family protein [Saprospiraceae bacterium]|nr:CotH kinase family protein [Lewinella sp.]
MKKTITAKSGSFFYRLILLGVGLFLTAPMFAQKKQKDLYDMDHIIEVKITFAESRWDAVLDSLKQMGNSHRLDAEVSVDGTLYKGVGVRYKGNSSYFNVRKEASTKLPFNIEFNHKIKDQRLPGGYETLKLSNVFRDPSFLREVLGYEIAGRYMPSPRANFAKVYVNDTYLGLYNCTESVDEDFLEKYYLPHEGDEEGALVKCDPDWHGRTIESCPQGDKASLMYLGPDSTCYQYLYEMKSDEGWDDLIELTRVLNKEPENLDKILNVDQALWMLAFNNVTVSLDSYTGRLCHNYYLYRDSFGLFHPILWDMNLCFGGFRYTGLGRPLSNEAMEEMSMFIHYKEQNEKRPLITTLLSNDLYRKIYVAHVKTIYEDYLQDSVYLQRAKEIMKMIAPYVQEDENKLYAYEDFQKNLYETTRVDDTNIIGLVELMAGRTTYLKDHPLIQKEQPQISDVKHEVSNNASTISARVEGAQQVWLYYRTQKKSPFQRLEMNNSSGYTGDNAESIYAVSLDKSDVLEYYLVAEGDKAASLSPARAAFEFYKVE